jgi:hypothetical protein
MISCEVESLDLSDEAHRGATAILLSESRLSSAAVKNFSPGHRIRLTNSRRFGSSSCGRRCRDFVGALVALRKRRQG